MTETFVESMPCEISNNEEDEYHKLSNFAEELRKMLAIIYNLVVGCDPVNLTGFLAKRLEVMLENNNLKELLEKEEEIKMDEYASIVEIDNISDDIFKFPSVDKNQQSLYQYKRTNYLNQSLPRSSMKDCCEHFLINYHITSAGTQFRVPDELQALFDSSIIQAIYNHLLGKKTGTLELRSMNKLSTDNLEYISTDPCTLAWETNGKHSVFNPTLSPLQNFKRAYPHLFRRLKGQYKEKKYVEKCIRRKPFKCPSYWCKKKIPKPLKKQIEEKVTEAAFQEESVEEGNSDESGSNQNKYLAEIIKMYNALAFKDTKIIEEKPMSPEEEKVEIEKFTKETQTPFCNNCENHDIVKDPHFYVKNKHKKSTTSLQNQCYKDLTSMYRPKIQLDWKKFVKQEIKGKKPKERNWFSEEKTCLNSYNYNLNFRSWRNEALLKAFTFSEDTPSEPLDVDTPDDVNEVCYYEPTQKKYVIKNSSFYEWDATNEFLAKDCPDVLREKTLVNIFYPEAEKRAKIYKPDSISSIPFDMLETLSGPEQEAKPATPDESDTRPKKTKLKKKQT